MLHMEILHIIRTFTHLWMYKDHKIEFTMMYTPIMLEKSLIVMKYFHAKYFEPNFGSNH